MTPFEVRPADPRLYSMLAEAGFGSDVFNPEQHRSCELVEVYVLTLAVELAGQLRLPALLAVARTLDEVLAAGDFVPAFRVPLRWLLRRLARAALVERDGDTYRLAAPLPAPPRTQLRAEGLARDPSYAPVYALLDEAAAIYPGVARGEVSAEAVLLRRAALWFNYFTNANAYYALNNRVAAHAAAARLPDAGGTVLEVGAGLGSATEALFEALGPRTGALGAYRATEPVHLFRRRAERTLGARWAGVPRASAGLDINQPWAAQDVPPGGYDLVWGVNVFHLARDLATTLREARAALVRGGWLVIGEGLRPLAGEPVGAEFPFQILESFVAVDTDDELRPEPGFLTAEQWLAALARAGFEQVEVVPDVIRLRTAYPGFLAGAVCGRRP
jgi:SAM-dependent methyltransferase